MAIHDPSGQIQAELDGETQVRRFKSVEQGVEVYYALRDKFAQLRALSLEPRAGTSDPDPRIREQQARTYAALSHCLTGGRIPGDEQRDGISSEHRWALDQIYGFSKPIWFVGDRWGVSEQKVSLALGRVLDVVRRRMNRRGLLRGGSGKKGNA